MLAYDCQQKPSQRVQLPYPCYMTEFQTLKKEMCNTPMSGFVFWA